MLEGLGRFGLTMALLSIAIFGYAWLTQVLADFAVKIVGG